jgi:hypothetical protein
MHVQIQLKNVVFYLVFCLYKEWDDPTVVPGRETYNDWTNVRGLNLVESISFFPHMEDRWKSLVDQRRRELPVNQQHDGPSSPDDDDVEKMTIRPKNTNNNVDVCCLADEDACMVNGNEQSVSVFSEVASLC